MMSTPIVLPSTDLFCYCDMSIPTFLPWMDLFCYCDDVHPIVLPWTDRFCYCDMSIPTFLPWMDLFCYCDDVHPHISTMDGPFLLLWWCPPPQFYHRLTFSVTVMMCPTVLLWTNLFCINLTTLSVDNNREHQRCPSTGITPDY